MFCCQSSHIPWSISPAHDRQLLSELLYVSALNLLHYQITHFVKLIEPAELHRPTVSDMRFYLAGVNVLRYPRHQDVITFSWDTHRPGLSRLTPASLP